MSGPRCDWTVWLAYRSRGRRVRGFVLRGGTLWQRVLTAHREYGARRAAREAALGLFPWLPDQQDRLVVLPRGRLPKRDIYHIRVRVKAR